MSEQTKSQQYSHEANRAWLYEFDKYKAENAHLRTLVRERFDRIEELERLAQQNLAWQNWRLDMNGEFLNQKPWVVTEGDMSAPWAPRFRCKLCGHQFAVGHTVRWVYANDAGIGTGNFFVCERCDGPDLLQRAKESRDLAVKLAKQWDLI